MLKPGLYEQVINTATQTALEEIPAERKSVAPIDSGEAAGVLAQYLTDVVQHGLRLAGEGESDLTQQVKLTNRIIDLIQQETGEPSLSELSVDAQGQQLWGLLQERDPLLALGKTAKDLPRPETSIAQSSLFTGAAHEPQMYVELKKEIASTDRMDMLVSFIKWSGLRLIIDELRNFTQNGGTLRIITTAYMGATDPKAIAELEKLPNTTIRISYETKSTRLHAKAYIFYRDTGFSTAYVGSSNLSKPAVSSGLEWNTKVTQQDLPEVMNKIGATFESYWNARAFERYAPEEHDRLVRAIKAEHYKSASEEGGYALDIHPYSYQQEILDHLEAERTVHGQFRNLVVAATGTGKTVISAFDYKEFRRKNPKSPCRLLFVAHREEILKQSLYTFRGVLKDANFGALFVGSHRPDSIDHVFMSIQTLNSQDFTEKTATDFYDYIVVDEFHHAAARTYQKLLQYYQPKVLLGLTATPERMDGQNILDYFNGRIAAEIRLPEAIDRKLLCPFQYFGVTDDVDLSEVKWGAGGYDKAQLSNVYTLSGAVASRRADSVITALDRYVTDMNDVKGLGFCVSIAHAQFMSEHFNSRGIPSIHLTGDSPDEVRNSAKAQLVSGDIRFIFVVDLYNEGVDIPEINTVLFLRPTESLTVFLQQLGRGLRLADGKECLTVLDFIGQAHAKYNFESKFSAMLTPSNRSVQKEIQDGFLTLPKGCYIQLEKVAQSYILANIKSHFGRKAAFVARIATFEEDSGLPLTMGNFLRYHHLEPKALLRWDSFSRMCVMAGVREDFDEPLETIVQKTLVRLTYIDSRRFILFLQRILTTDCLATTGNELPMLDMLQFTIWQKSWQDCGFENALDGVRQLRSCPVLCGELLELLAYQYDNIDFVDSPVQLPYPCSLDVHCTYTRDQILVALGFMKPNTVREGVKYLPEKQTDLFFITLNKSEKFYSPTTMYHDYSINDILFHWQSQSTTGSHSATGQRYIHHKEKGSYVLLFVRENKSDAVTNSASPYTFLGTAQYGGHKGERPMNITWRLEAPIPAKYQKKTSQLDAG
ncbi:DUF3427 domain-containing protein [Bengtsoniella intestinalis]|uniref:DUF3427 domain-containing protein n=1 Tax=Bengtsoniella intestinalis TaxID=3073143 RepID=UPI00391EF34F